MSPNKPPTSDKLAQRQRDALEEWRRLCDALENAQGEELAKTCRNRFQFIKTYQVYGARIDALAAELRRAAEKGDYTFFRERGVPTHIMDWRFAEQLLQIWKSKVSDKKRRMAEIFQLKYGEPLDKVVRSDEETFQLNSVDPMHDSDALLQLSGMAQEGDFGNELEALRDEVRQLQKQLEELAAHVKSELTELKRGR